MGFVAGQLLEPVGQDGGTEQVQAEQRTVGQLLAPAPESGQQLVLEVAGKAGTVGGARLLPVRLVVLEVLLPAGDNIRLEQFEHPAVGSTTILSPQRRQGLPDTA